MTNNNTNTTPNVSVAGLMIRPYDLSSKIAHEKPGAHLFDDRSDFMLLAHQRYVAVLFNMINDNAYQTPTRGQSVPVAVWLMDVTTGEALSSKSLDVRFRPRERYKEFRVDMMLEYADVKADHLYEVRVCERDTGQILGYKRLRFYDMPRLKVLPTKWFKALSASACDDLSCDCENMRGFSSSRPDIMRVTFQMYCDLFTSSDAMPQLEIRFTAPDGEYRTFFVHPQMSESDDTVSAECAFAVDADVSGVYYADLRCMGHSFAGAVFAVGLERLTGVWTQNRIAPIPNYTPEKGLTRWKAVVAEASTSQPETDDEFERALNEFMETDRDAEPEPIKEQGIDDMVGLASVKSKLESYTQLVRFSRLREQCGLSSLSTPLHAMFLGSPGTGKTTVAKIIGRRLKEIGVLSEGHVVVRERASLVGKYYNSESESTKKALEEAQGGILFIDEAYQLHQPDDPKDPGKFVIETLLTALADESNRDWMLILAGYSEPMKAMFSLNPGLKSRIPVSNIYTFEDFTESELIEIAESYFARHRFTLTTDARSALAALLAHDYRNRDREFGNARHVVNLIQTDIFPAMAMRLSTVAEPTPLQLTLIEASDIPAPQLKSPASRPRIGFAV